MVASQGDIPSIMEPVGSPTLAPDANLAGLSLSFSLSLDKSENGACSLKKLQGPKLGSCERSGTIIVPCASPYVEIHDEKYDDGDAPTMSPRRGSEETEKMGEEARQALIKQAEAVKETLLEIANCLQSLQSEQEKLEDGNRCLQAYVGELMQTSKPPPPAPRKVLYG